MPARLFVAFGFLRVAHNGIPRQYRVAVLAQRLTPQFDQLAADQGIFQAVGAVEIPGVASATRASARFVVWQVRAGTGVIGLLYFPRHQPVFNVDFPATGAGAVDAVGRTHDFVELPALAITVFPVAVGVIHLPVPVGESLAFLFEVAKAIQQFTHDVPPDCSQKMPKGQCPTYFELQQCGMRVNSKSLTQISDSGERAQPTHMQLEI
ncbi:hypothetical protein D3C78_620220 [compost metagenome]